MSDTIRLVDAEHRDIAPQIPVFDPATTTIADIRANLIAAFSALLPATNVDREIHTAPGQKGAPDVRLLIYRPKGVDQSSGPALLYIHGGGFVAGTPDMCDAASARLATDTRSIIIAVDYRLAPETPFPGPLEDCYAALAWVFENASTLGIDPNRIGVIGDSAGGGLAAALALLARDRGVYRLKAQVLIYPMLDHRTGTDDAPIDNPNTGEFIWNRTTNRFGWNALRGRQNIDEKALGYFSPACAQDLSRLPPAFIAVGSLDLFLEEDVAYALRLTRAGVPAELHVYAGGIHGFDLLPGSLGARFHADMTHTIQHLLAP